MKTIKTCPLGHTCEKVVDDHIEVCHWYTTMRQSDPVSGQEKDVKECAITWLPVLSTEQSSASRFVAEAIHSLRNETISRQDEALRIAEAHGVKAITDK